jgi:hypothetical protein
MFQLDDGLTLNRASPTCQPLSPALQVTVWKGNVFQLDDGPLRHPTDKVNKDFLATLAKAMPDGPASDDHITDDHIRDITDDHISDDHITDDIDLLLTRTSSRRSPRRCPKQS